MIEEVTVDAYGESEQATAFLTVLEEHLALHSVRPSLARPWSSRYGFQQGNQMAGSDYWIGRVVAVTKVLLKNGTLSEGEVSAVINDEYGRSRARQR